MRRGNNYSGARWTHSQGRKPARSVQPSAGVSRMGGSNRPTTTTWRNDIPATRLDRRDSICLAVLWDGESLLTFYATPGGRYWPCGIPRHEIWTVTVQDA